MLVDPADHLPSGLVARRWRTSPGGTPDPADVDAMLATACASEVSAIGAPDTTAVDIEEMFGSPGTDHDSSVIVEEAGTTLGFAWVEKDPLLAESWIDPYVFPVREDLLDGLLRYAVAVAHEHRREFPDQPTWQLRSGSFATDALQCSALERVGFQRVRRFWRMRIDLSGTRAESRTLPSGVEIHDAATDPLRGQLYEVETTAFRDHWNHEAVRPYDQWFAYFDLPYLDPGGWWLLTVDGVPAASCILDDSRRDIGEGYVRSLGVLREFRGRGLARLLLARAFDYYRDRGYVGVQLGVDSESPTGANHLYESMGMTPHRVIDAWGIPIG